ncbi:MAG TPA: DNA modification methylase [Clostridiales bacterium]|nr:DNA modification methylase [Clostridiales bacterium]
MEIMKLPITDLKPAVYNPRKNLKSGDPEYEKLRRSFQEFGYVEPIVWNRQTQTIVGGHQRLKVLAEMGETEIECVIVDMPQEKEKALNVALNKINGQWDEELLAGLLKDLETQAIDLAITGFDVSEIESLMKQFDKSEAAEDDFDTEKALEEIVEPVSKRGDIWILGRHRLMCGDSTVMADVEKLMDGALADMVFTDPPWNVDLGGDPTHPSWKPRQILNDSMSTEDFKDFMNKTFACMYGILKPGGMMYVVMSAQEWGNCMLTLKENGFHWSSTIIWNKDRIVLSRKDYHTRYEPIWYGWHNGAPRRCPLEDRKQCDVWDIPRPSVSELHPTTKPIELVARAIKNSSYPDHVVVDLFGGSGTTLIAAEQTNRSCFMGEMDEKYCDVIAKRFALQTGRHDGIYVLRDGEKIGWESLCPEK